MTHRSPPDLLDRLQASPAGILTCQGLHGLASFCGSSGSGADSVIVCVLAHDTALLSVPQHAGSTRPWAPDVVHKLQWILDKLQSSARAWHPHVVALHELASVRVWDRVFGHSTVTYGVEAPSERVRSECCFRVHLQLPSTDSYPMMILRDLPRGVDTSTLRDLRARQGEISSAFMCERDAGRSIALQHNPLLPRPLPANIAEQVMEQVTHAAAWLMDHDVFPVHLGLQHVWLCDFDDTTYTYKVKIANLHECAIAPTDDAERERLRAQVAVQLAELAAALVSAPPAPPAPPAWLHTLAPASSTGNQPSWSPRASPLARLRSTSSDAG